MSERSLSIQGTSPENALLHLKEVVQEALIAAKTYTPKYSSMFVICIQWEKDDVNGDKDCKEIEETFKDYYGATVERVKLALKKYVASDVLKLAKGLIDKILEQPSPTLVVVYYSGHGSNKEGLVWHPTAIDTDSCLDFNVFEVCLLHPLRFTNDILLLLDCCCAMAIMKGGGHQFTHEVIGACGVNARSPVRAFTPALCKILRQPVKSVGISVSYLHRLLVAERPVSPIHTFLFGTETIRLIPTANLNPEDYGDSKKVVISIHLNEDLSDDAVDKFIEFLSKNAELSGATTISVIEKHKTESTLIVAIFPLYLASILSMYLDISFIYLVN